MERLESISHLRQLLVNDIDLNELMQNKGFSYVLSKLKERFCNFNDFDEEIIEKEVDVRFSAINHLIDKEGKLKTDWKVLIMKKIYWKLFEQEMDSEDKKYARRAGLGSSMLHFDGIDRVKVLDILANLEKGVINNELKNLEQANQFVDALIYEMFSK